MSPRTPTANTPAITIQGVEPPPRKRERKITLPLDVLEALREAIGPDTWTTNGMTYGGEEGAKDATTAARIYRRDLSRHMNISERKIRTRVWEATEGEWVFALALRKENGNGGEAS